MNEQAANTISVTVYTPSGTRAYINFGNLITAAELDSRVAELGYLVNAPGVEAGEDVESILYVCRVNHRNDKGEVSPHIAFYYEAPGMRMRFCHEYLNSADDIAAFETATGLKVDSMPLLPGKTLPQYKDDPDMAQYIVRLTKPIRIARKTVPQKDGKTSHRVKRYVDTIGKATGGGATKWTDNLQEMDWLKQTIISMRETYGDTAIDTAKAAIKTADYQNAREYVDGLVLQLWRPRMMEASKFLYTENGQYNPHKHEASIDKRLQDTGDLGISADMTLYEVVNRLIRYRALHDLFIDSGDYQNIFGMSFVDYVDKHGHVNTWQRINEFYAAQLEPAKTKAS